jgi:hypothetical protein
MERYTRLANGQAENPIPIGRPFSNFDFIETNFGDLIPMRRIMSQVRMLGGQTMIKEKLELSEDIRQENEDLIKEKPDFTLGEAYRLSFFNKPLENVSEILSLTDEDFLGYATIICDDAPRIHESVLRHSLHRNNYIHQEQTWRCLAGGKKFNVQGYLYAQQNGVTNCCGHVALRTVAARFHPNGDMLYREMNDLIMTYRNQIGDTERKKNGMRQGEILYVLDHLGLSTSDKYVLDCETTPPKFLPVPFQKYIWLY